MPAKPRPIEDRFWEKVRKTRGCWLWTAAQAGRGYGYFMIHQNGKKTVTYAHRVAYTLSGKKIPWGMCVLHKCDVRLCVRPEHLFVGTNAHNTADMVAKGRIRRGELSSSAKLSAKQVLRIRKLAEKGVRNCELSIQFKVGRPQITRIVRGTRWAHLLQENTSG